MSGVEAVEEVARKVGVPVIGIGGITPRNVREVFKGGVAGVAVLASVSGSSDPAKAVRVLLKNIGEFSTASGDGQADS